MKSVINNYVLLLRDHREQYGLYSIILYQIGLFYYIFSNDKKEMESITSVIKLPWSRKGVKDDYYRCWIRDDELIDKVLLLVDNDFTCIVYKVNNRLCIHNRREKDCKLCGDLCCSHLLYDVMMPDIDLEYVVI